MKRVVLTSLSLIMTLIALSQTGEKQGTITYEEVIKFQIELADIPPDMQNLLPTENKTNTVLYFNESASLYRNKEEVEDVQEDMNGQGVMVKISMPEMILYRDLTKKQTLQQTEFMTRKFLIKGEYNDSLWKITGNTKMILGYPCQEAFKKDSLNTDTVWFTPAIQVPTGPAEFADLPGVILEVKSGERSIIATAIDLNADITDKIEKPDKGKKVTKEEYKSIVEEKTKEMGGENIEGGKRIIMRISH